MRRTARWGLSVAAIVLVAIVACSNNGGTHPCNEDPFQCGAGTTCWTQVCLCAGGSCDPSNCVPHFTCMASAAGKKPGDSCHDLIGTTTCGDNQACIENAGVGVCRAYCDMTVLGRGCAAGETCTAVTMRNGSPPPQVHVCVPLATDAGTD